MTAPNDLATAMDAARAAGTGPVDGFLERIAERVGARATVKTVFGDPIERDGITVIPVAKVRWGFGGGAGTGPIAVGPGRPADAETARADDGGDDDDRAEDGSGARAASGTGQGGGGGVTADPVGWIEIGPDGAAFQPIVPAMPSPGFLLAAGATAALVLRALARLLRG